jgi:hypothetical protein
MYNNIFAQTRAEIDDYINNPINIVQGYSFNTYQTIKRCHLYRNSQFEDSNLYNGREKIFYNIVNNPCDTETRYYNFDTKDIRLVAGDFESDLASFLITKENKLWLKKTKFANLLNQLAEELPPYGSVIVKKASKDAEILDLRKVAFDPTVDKITKSRFFITEYEFTESELREKEGKWENTEDAIRLYASSDTPDSYVDEKGVNHIKSTKYIKVHERFGEVPEKWLKGDYSDTTLDEKYVRALFIITGADKNIKDNSGKTYKEEGLVLFKSKWTGAWPLQDFHRKKTKGRWLGIGTIEELFPVQERVNEIVNQERVAMEISSMHLFQTDDPTILKNVLSDVNSGTILKKTRGSNGLIPVANEERNLMAYSTDFKLWTDNGRSITFAYNMAEDMPSSMPATNAIIQNKNTAGVFTFRRENIGNALRDFFNDFVLKQLIRDLTPEHVFEFMGDTTEIQKYDELVVSSLSRRAMIEKMLNGQLFSDIDLETTKEDIRKQLKSMGASRWTKVKEGLYKNSDIKYDFIISNEQEDLNIMSQNIFTVIQTLAKSPGVLQDPVLKTLIYKYANTIGVGTQELELAEQQQSAMTNQAQVMPGMNPNQQPNQQPNEAQIPNIRQIKA